MRLLMEMRMPVEKGNAAIKDPNFQQNLKAMLDDLKPEAAYFAPDNGQRAAWFVVQAKDASELPRLAEPFWFAFNADISFTPIVLAEDLAKAGPAIAAAAKKYGK